MKEKKEKIHILIVGPILKSQQERNSFEREILSSLGRQSKEVTLIFFYWRDTLKKIEAIMENNPIKGLIFWREISQKRRNIFYKLINSLVKKYLKKFSPIFSQIGLRRTEGDIFSAKDYAEGVKFIIMGYSILTYYEKN